LVTFGSATAWPVIADVRLRGRQITLGAGQHGLAVAVAADEVLQALDARSRTSATLSRPRPHGADRAVDYLVDSAVEKRRAPVDKSAHSVDSVWTAKES
jgi:hypothetical protein